MPMVCTGVKRVGVVIPPNEHVAVPLVATSATIPRDVTTTCFGYVANRTARR